MALSLVNVKTFSHRNIAFSVYICQLSSRKIISVDSSNVINFTEGSLFDKNTETFWETDKPFPHWIQFNFREERKIEAYTLQSGRQEKGSICGMPRDWEFQGSNNGSNWTVIDTRTNQIGWEDNEKALYKLPNPASYKYYRLYITAGNALNLRLPELELVEKYAPKVINLTADSETSTPVRNLLDNNITSFWETGNPFPFPHWVQCDFGREITMKAYTLQTGYDGVGSTDAMPRDWEFQGSNDKSIWTILDRRKNEYWKEAEKRTYKFSNSTPYRYYRLYITGCIHPNAVRLYELKIMEEY